MVTAIYDGYCVICNQTRRTVIVLDWLHHVEFLNIHNWNEINQRYPTLDYETAMGQMHLITSDGQLIGGFPAVRRMLRELPLGYPIWLLLQLPGMGTIGDKVYKFIAHNRYRINRFFGMPVCEDGSCKIHP